MALTLLTPLPLPRSPPIPAPGRQNRLAVPPGHEVTDRALGDPDARIRFVLEHFCAKFLSRNLSRNLKPEFFSTLLEIIDSLIPPITITAPDDNRGVNPNRHSPDDEGGQP